MFYLALKRDLEKISLARKHVLSDREMIETFATIHSISAAGLDRIKTLRSEFGNLAFFSKFDPVL